MGHDHISSGTEGQADRSRSKVKMRLVVPRVGTSLEVLKLNRLCRISDRLNKHEVDSLKPAKYKIVLSHYKNTLL